MAASIKATIEGLNRIDQARKKRGWTKKAAAWCDAAGGLSASTLDRFWARQPISQQSFVAICKAVGIEDWEVVSNLALSNFQSESPVFSNYDEQTWSGRETLVNDLLPKLQERTRLLWITGISGIGKTALGECLASQAWKHDPSFQWIYLEILEGQSVDFASVAADLLAKLGDRDIDPQERNNPEQLAKRLLQKLQAHPYWIQLDALERLLNPEQPTEFVDSYWTTFLQRCLTESNLISRLVLTAQALPAVLADFSDRYPNTWTEIRLSGLSDVNQRLEFFTRRGVVVEEANREILTHIAAVYEGHPLVMKVIAEDILKEFAGDVLYYWQINQREFEQVARELQAARLDETEYNEALDRKVRERIKKSLEQLPADALDLLCRSSVFRRPVPKKFWLAMISDRSIQKQKSAYRILSDRALIEKESTSIRQHNLIRDVAYDLLKVDLLAWESAERQAAYLWLTAYQPVKDASNLETIRGYLEAFHHYCNIESWAEVRYILSVPSVHWPNTTIDGQLGIWGYYYDQIQLSERLVGQIDASTDAFCWNNLGMAHYALGNYEEAIQCHLKHKNIAQELQNTYSEGVALGGLGNAYMSLLNYEKALDCHLKHLDIVRQVGSLYGEGIALGNIGNIYACLGEYEESAKYHCQALKISRKTQDRLSQGKDLANLGKDYAYLEQVTKADCCYQKALPLLRESGDRRSEAKLLGNLGVLRYKQRKITEAISFIEQQIAICHEIGALDDEAIALCNLGEILLIVGKHSEALNKLNKALIASEKLENSVTKVVILKNLARLHLQKNKLNLAYEYCQQALALATELGIPLKEECEALQLKIENEKLKITREENDCGEEN